MSKKPYEFMDRQGTFRWEDAENTSALYFPIAAENGLKGCVTPSLGGDLKLSQDAFVLQPVSVEDLHNNKGTRNFWCRFSTGECWSATGVSARAQSEKFVGEQDKTVLTAGPMWQQTERISKRLGVRARILTFVPLSGEAEIMYVVIANQTDRTLCFTPTAAIPLYARSADNIRDHRHVTSLLHRIETTEHAVCVTPTFSFDERGHRRNTVTYFVGGVTGAGEAPEGFCPIAERYLGEGGSYEQPESVLRGLDYEAGGRDYAGYEAVGAVRFAQTTLEPGQEAGFCILTGAAQDKGQIGEWVKRFDTAAKVEKAWLDTKRFWLEKINVSYHTADADFDNTMFWVNFQPMLRRIYGCSFLPHHDYGKGGRGWRDLWQDCLALLIMNPDGVRGMLIDYYGGVRMDGTNATIIGSGQGEFIADRNHITRVWMDHGVWPLLTTALYIGQTGDLSVLLKENTYFKDGQERRGTAEDAAWKTACAEASTTLCDEKGNPYYGTVLEHILVQNLTAFYDVGEHNHLRLRDADWNDALDMASKRGESVAFSAAYAGNLQQLADMLDALQEKLRLAYVEVAEPLRMLLQGGEALHESVEQKRALLERYCESCYPHISGQKASISLQETAALLREKAEWMREHIRRTEWLEEDEDAGWFNSYYDDHGRKVESSGQQAVRMMLTGQVFAILSETAEEEQVRRIARACDRHLYASERGGYCLNTDFGEVKTDLGRMFGFAYGHKENGAVFSHMTVMYAYALYRRGFVKEGWKAVRTLYGQAADAGVSKIYPGIPEYFNDRGRGMYHYLTGAASWLMLTLVTQIFGVRGQLGQLCLQPKLTAEQFDSEGRAGIRLEFADRKWNIVYVNKEKLEYGDYCIRAVYLNGGALETEASELFLLPRPQLAALQKDMTHEIIAELGAKTHRA